MHVGGRAGGRDQARDTVRWVLVLTRCVLHLEDFFVILKPRVE